MQINFNPDLCTLLLNLNNKEESCQEIFFFIYYRKGEDPSLINEVIGFAEEHGLLKKIFYPDSGE